MYHKFDSHERNLLLCAALLFVSGFFFLFRILYLGNVSWLLIFPCFLIVLAFLPANRAVKKYNQRFVLNQSRLIEAGFPVASVDPCDIEKIYNIFVSSRFRSPKCKYINKYFSSYVKPSRLQNDLSCYIRWIEDSSDDLCELLRKEYLDFSNLQDNRFPEKNLILFIRRHEISPRTKKQLNAFCTMLLRSELNFCREKMRLLPEITPSRLASRIYRHDQMILPVLIDHHGNGQYIDASSLRHPKTTPLRYTYGSCCQLFELFLEDLDS